jgi:hypothetical protein
MKIRIQPYKMFSGGARALANHCGILRATKKQVQRHGNFDYIINWGSSERKFEGEYVNPPEAVAIASDKLKTAEILGNFGIPQPEWTRDKTIAQQWLDAGDTVVGRHLLRASAGRGISLYRRDPEAAEGGDAEGHGHREQAPPTGNAEDNNPAMGGIRAQGEGGYETRLKNAPLYTKYFKKAEEYRVHVFGDRVLDIQQKRKRQEVPNEQVDYQIRNAAAGWVFCRNEVECPAAVTDAAVRAVSALGLDFGAVDIGYNRHSGLAAVFEVNTAPGLEGTTLDRYYYAFLEVFPALSGGAYNRRRAA